MRGTTLAGAGPTSHKTEYEQAVAHVRQGRRDEAAAILQGLVAADPATPLYRETLIDALRKARHDSAAVAAGEAAVAAFPGHAKLWMQLSLAQADALDFEAADAAQAMMQQLDIRAVAERALPALDGAAPARLTAELIDTAVAAPAVRWSICRILGRVTAVRLAALAEGLAPVAIPTDAPEWPLGPRLPLQDPTPVPARAAAGAADRPLLSVMVPVYDPNPDWLRACLQSVLRQDQGPGWAEVVVLDDGAGGVAEQVAGGFGARVEYRRNAAVQGLLNNHNRCLALARGRFVHILHQDDHVATGFYDAVLAPMRADPDLVAGLTGVALDTGAGAPAPEPLERRAAGRAADLALRLIRRQRIQFAGIVLRRAAVERLGGFAPARSFAFDWDMWARLARHGPVWYDPRPLATTRLHAESATHAIGLADRVADILRTQHIALAALPPGARRQAAARVGFAHQCTDAWQLLIEGLAEGAPAPGLRGVLAGGSG